MNRKHSGYLDYNSMNKLRENLSQIMQDHDWNITELAIQCNTPYGTMLKLLNGTRRSRFYTISRMADSLEIPVSELLKKSKDNNYCKNISYWRKIEMETELVKTLDQLSEKTLKHLYKLVKYFYAYKPNEEMKHLCDLAEYLYLYKQNKVNEENEN